MNYFLVNYFLVQTDRQTESDAYEPTVQVAQVGSKIGEVPAKYMYLQVTILHSQTCLYNTGPQLNLYTLTHVSSN